MLWLIPLLPENHSSSFGAGLGSSFTHPIPELSRAAMTGGIDIATNVGRCRDHSGIASVHLFDASIDIHLARGGPAPGQTHRIYSVDLAPLGAECDLCRCWRWR